jgi:hypothetical protein
LPNDNSIELSEPSPWYYPNTGIILEGNKNNIIVIAIVIELNLQVQFENYNIRMELNQDFQVNRGDCLKKS